MNVFSPGHKVTQQCGKLQYSVTYSHKILQFILAGCGVLFLELCQEGIVIGSREAAMSQTITENRFNQAPDNLSF